MKRLTLKSLLPEHILTETESSEVEQELKTAFDGELKALASQFNAALQSAQTKVQNKSPEEAEELLQKVSPEMAAVVDVNEAINISAEEIMLLLSTALAMPAIVQTFGILAKKIAKKLGSSGNIGEAIEHFAHKWHHVYIKVVRKTLDISLYKIPLFKRLPEKTKESIAEIFFYVIIGLLGYYSGSAAVSYIERSNLLKGVYEGLLSAIKSGELVTWIRKTIAAYLESGL